MLRQTVVMAAALAFIGTAASASPLIVKLSRPNTSYITFLDDRSACLMSADRSSMGGFVTAGSFSRLWVRYDVRTFAACMNAKGYMLDPNGYKAIQYQKDDAGHEWVTPL